MGGVDGGDRQHTEGAKANGADQGGEAGDGVRVGHGDGGDRPINTGMGDKFTLTDFFLAVLIHVPNFEGAINVKKCRRYASEQYGGGGDRTHTSP